MEDSALVHQKNSAPPKLPMPPAQKLKALQSLLCQLQQKLKQMPPDPVCSGTQALEAELPKDASYMARIYLKNQKEIAHASIKVTICHNPAYVQNSIWIGIENYHPQHCLRQLDHEWLPKIDLAGQSKEDVLSWLQSLLSVDHSHAQWPPLMVLFSVNKSQGRSSIILHVCASVGGVL